MIWKDSPVMMVTTPLRFMRLPQRFYFCMGEVLNFTWKALAKAATRRPPMSRGLRRKQWPMDAIIKAITRLTAHTNDFEEVLLDYLTLPMFVRQVKKEDDDKINGKHDKDEACKDSEEKDDEESDP